MLAFAFAMSSCGHPAVAIALLAACGTRCLLAIGGQDRDESVAESRDLVHIGRAGELATRDVNEVGPPHQFRHELPRR